jgi:hypothetical protein
MFFHYQVDRMSSQVLIYFKNPNFFPMVIQQQLTKLDFISYCGGSLGLFLGFSAMSAVELVYYFTLRLIFKRIGRNKVESISRVESNEGKQKLFRGIHGHVYCTRMQSNFDERTQLV